MPAHDAKGTVKKFSGWYAEASKKGKFKLRYGLATTKSMCWCEYEWRAYPVKR